MTPNQGRGTSAPEPTAAIRVLIADDQRVVRQGLAMLVALFDGVDVVATASDGAEAVQLALALHPDVVLMDIRMPILDGSAATKRLGEVLPTARVLVLTTYADDDSIFPALRAGACGYLTKDASGKQIEAAIRSVHAGQTYLDPVVQQRLVASVSGHALTPDQGGADLDPPAGLTSREAEVLALIADGLSNAEIAARLTLSAATVKTHVNRIFSKTNARDRAQAVRYAYRNGLATPNQ
jgi:DNA-binding NarL/FixJ family response regulator